MDFCSISYYVWKDCYMDVITSTIVSGVIYDMLKNSVLITAKSIKEYFLEELLEISNEQARQIAEQARSIDFSDISNISRESFIENHQNQFNTINNVNSNVNQNVNIPNNSGMLFNNSASTLHQTINLPENTVQKKS